jgi:predicted anti-sigma-YlaC factor YlaD
VISCTQAVRRLWEYLENEVSDADRANVEEHLAYCRRCCGEVEFARELRVVLAAAAEVEQHLPPDVEQRLSDVLDGLHPATTPLGPPSAGPDDPESGGDPR